MKCFRAIIVQHKGVLYMRDEYKKAYLTLFNAVTDALEALKMKNYGIAESMLVLAQAQAEEDFLRAGEENAGS